MKALTLWQPWAWAIAHAGKTIENRTWQPPAALLGRRIAIHAGQHYDADAWAWAIEETTARPPDKRLCPRGVVEAVATVTGAVAIAGSSVQWVGSLTEEEVCELVDSAWFQGPVGWVLRDVVALPEPVPCRGARGLWDLPAEVEALVMGQVP